MNDPDDNPVSVVGRIAESVRRASQRVAVSCEETEWSYQRLWQESGCVLAAIRAAGCPPDARIVVGLPPGCRWVAGLLGIWRAGAVTVLSNVEHPPDRLREMCESAEFVLVDLASSRIAWPGRLGRIVLADKAAELRSDSPQRDTEASQAACVLHTSGSSGTPKPVVLEHRGLVHRITRFQPLYRIVASDRIAQVAAASVDVILWETLLALVSSARLEIPVGLDRVPGAHLAEWLSRREITVLACTPTTLAALPEVTLPALRLIVLGGENLDPGRHRFWIERHQVANAYGPTEATIATHVCPQVPLDGPAPIGHPVPGVQDYLLDAQQRPVPDGQVGDLYVGGAGLAAGYDGLPGATAAAFRTFVLDGALRRVYRTGDHVYRRADGQLVFVGRADRQLNLGGYRLEPAEVEIAAAALPGITAAAALADGQPGHQVLLLHVAVPARNVTAAELRAHLAHRLPAPAVPVRIHLWPQLPTTDSGKVDLPALAARLQQQSAEATAPQVASAGLPEQVMRWWTEATGALPVDGADFFDSGGDSLGAVRLLHQVNETHGTAITVTAFVADPTPEHVARNLADSEKGSR